MKLTYKQLAVIIDRMSDDNQDKVVTIFSMSEGEFYPISHIEFATEDNDTLDIDHPYLVTGG